MRKRPGLSGPELGLCFWEGHSAEAVLEIVQVLSDLACVQLTEMRASSPISTCDRTQAS